MFNYLKLTIYSIYSLYIKFYSTFFNKAHNSQTQTALAITIIIYLGCVCLVMIMMICVVYCYIHNCCLSFIYIYVQQSTFWIGLTFDFSYICIASTRDQYCQYWLHPILCCCCNLCDARMIYMVSTLDYKVDGRW